MNAARITPTAPRVADAIGTVSAELTAVLAQLQAGEDQALTIAATRLNSANRVFVLGAGRSGLALRMVAMRLMHLGLTVHVVGETTSPAIGTGDVLLVASGSGTTAAIVRAAETAHTVGAEIVAITTVRQSALGRLADITVVIPAAAKQDHAGTVSAQYSGGLFEQAVLLVGDSIFHALWQASGLSAQALWPRHSNLE